MKDVLGKALLDHQQGNINNKLWIHNNYGEREEMPVATYFRSLEEMSSIELLALEGCVGEILDVGAAAGCHSLILQQRKFKVTALDISEGAVAVMKQRGIKKTVKANIFTYHKKQFNTLLLLMNGIGVAGTLDGLKTLLHHFKKIIRPGGHILFDSSDVKYIYESEELPEHYYGEIEYRYEYRGEFGEWFKWLYIDPVTMNQAALQCGYKMQLLERDKFAQYLGRLTIK